MRATEPRAARPSRRSFIGGLAAAPIIAASLPAGANAGAVGEVDLPMNMMASFARVPVQVANGSTDTWEAALARLEVAKAKVLEACAIVNKSETSYYAGRPDRPNIPTRVDT